jgi:hypothetical protein
MSKDMKKMTKKANELKDKLVDLLNESDVETHLALIVLSSMAVDCAINMVGVQPHEFIRMISQSVCLAVEANEEEEEGEDDEPTISRTTH